MKVVDGDESDDKWDCRRLTDLEHALKIAYYTARLIKYFP